MTETRKWYDEDDPTAELWSTVRSLRQRQSWRTQSDELALRLYSDMRYVGYSSQGGAATSADVIEARMGDNVIRAIIRTINSKVGRHQLRPFVLTDGGSWEQLQQADLRERWLVGKLREQKADELLWPAVRLHALVLGTGCLRSYGDPERGACLEVIPPTEIVIDDSEARYGDPRSMYFARVVDRDVLRARFPRRAHVLDDAPSGPAITREWRSGVGAWDSEQSSNLCLVVEAYHLPSSQSAGDGRHVVSVDGGWLVNEEWKRDHFPCAWLRGELRPMGFWGIGVPEDLAGAQLEVNRTTLARQEMVELLAVPHWLVERTSKVVKSHISNLIGRVLEYTGVPPQLASPPAVPPDIWQHAGALKQSMFEARGVSQLSAQMLKPAGLNSGKALRAYTELESELLVDLIRGYEQAFKTACELLVEEQRELGDVVQDQAVTVIGRGDIEQIHWREINPDWDKYVIDTQAISALSSTVSGRIEDVYDLRDLGVLTDPEEIRDLINLPDLRRQKRRRESARGLVDKIIEHRIVKRGEWVQPEPTWPLDLCTQRALETITELELYEDAPADRLELLRQFVEACRQLLEVGDGTGTDPAADATIPGGLSAPEPGPVGPELGPGAIPGPGPAGPVGPVGPLQ